MQYGKDKLFSYHHFRPFEVLSAAVEELVQILSAGLGRHEQCDQVTISLKDSERRTWWEKGERNSKVKPIAR